MDYSDVFISYRRKNVEFVKRLDAAFKARGQEVWVDWEDIPPGSEGFSDDIKRGIEGADTFIAVLSPDYLESTYCVDLELGYALQLKKKIIPIVHQKFEGQPVPEGIGHINWVYFTPHAGQENVFEEAFQRVIQAMETDLDHVRNHTRLLLRAQEWEGTDKQRSFLLDGVEVEEAENWLTTAVNKDPAPTKLHSVYIHESRKAETRRQRVLLGVAGVAMIVLTVLAIAAIFLWFDASNQRENAENNLVLAQTNESLAVESALTATIAQGQAEESAEEAQSLLWTSFAEQALDNNENDIAIALAISANSIENPPSLAQQMLADVAYAPGGRHLFTHHRDRILDMGYDDTQADPFTVYAVAYNADATRAFSIGADLTLMIWDLDPTSESFNTLLDHVELPYSADTFDFRQVLANQEIPKTVPFDVSPDGRYGVIYRTDSDTEQYYADIFDIDPTSDTFGTLLREYVSTDVSISPYVGFDAQAGTLLVSQCVRMADFTCGESVLMEWNPIADDNGVVRTMQGTWGEVIAMNTQSQVMVTVDSFEDGIIRLYDLTDGTHLRDLEGNLGYLGAGNFNADGRLFAASVFDVNSDTQGSMVATWDIETGHLIQQFRSPSPNDASDIVFSPDNRHVLVMRVGQAGVQVTIYNLLFGWELRSTIINVGYVDNAHFSADGRRVLIGSRRGDVHVWDVFNGIEARRWSHDIPRIQDYELSVDGGLALMSTADGQMVLWDRTTDTEVARYSDYEHEIVGFLPDNTAILLSRIENRIWLWNPTTGEEIRTLVSSDLVTSWMVTLSHDGTHLLTVDNQNVMTLWDVSTWTQVQTYIGFDAQLMNVAFSSDDSMVVATGFGGQVDAMLWETMTGTALHTFNLGTSANIQRIGFNPVIFTPDNEHIVIGGRDGHLYMWDVATGEADDRYQFVHNHAVTALAISPDGQHMVSGDYIGNIHIIEVSTGFELRHYSADEGAVTDITFSADGRTAILSFDQGNNQTRTNNRLGDYLPDFLADDILAWDTIEIHVHPALPALQAWIEMNRSRHEFTCEQREQFRITPYCDEEEAQIEATNTAPTATPVPTESAESTTNSDLSLATVGQNFGVLDDTSQAIWRYSGRAGEVLTITVDASFVSNIVLLHPQTGAIMAEYDTDDGGAVPRIADVTLAEDGDVLIEITSVESNPNAEYILVIESE